MTTSTALAPHPRCVLTELPDGTGVVLHLDTRFYYTLNRAAVASWKALSAGPGTAEAIGAALAREFVVDDASAAADARALLEELRAEGLVTNIQGAT